MWNKKADESTKDRHGPNIRKKHGSEGGKSTVLKGMAKLKVTDPERFKAIYANRKKRSKKTDVQHGIRGTESTQTEE